MSYNYCPFFFFFSILAFYERIEFILINKNVAIEQHKAWSIKQALKVEPGFNLYDSSSDNIPAVNETNNFFKFFF